MSSLPPSWLPPSAEVFALQMPDHVHEVMGSGLEGSVAGRKVRVGSHQLIFGARKPDDWAARALRRASWRSALEHFRFSGWPHYWGVAACR